MKTYTILYAEDVPHYGTLVIDAEDDAAALAAAQMQDPSGIATDPDYENSSCKRIVHIQANNGDTFAYDIPLDNSFLRYGGEPERRLCDVAADLLKTLREIAQIPLYGEPLPDSMADLKADMIRDGEYDEADQSYTPCVDTESTHLQYAVETARAVLAKAEGGTP